MKLTVLRAGIDIDGVLADCATGILNKYNLLYDKNLSPDDLEYFGDLNALEGIEVIYSKENKYSSVEPFLYAPLMDAAATALHYLRNSGFMLHLITARPESVVGMETRIWLSHNNVRYDTLTFAEDKVAIYKELLPDIIIDDHIENLRKGEPYSKAQILVDQAWNRNEDKTGLIVIPSMRELPTIVQILFMKGIIT